MLLFAAASVAWMPNDALEKIQTPGQAFIAEVVLRTGAKVENATWAPAKVGPVLAKKNRILNVTMQDVRFTSGEEKVVCRLKIIDSENFYLVGCWDQNQKPLHKQIGSYRTDFFAKPIFEVQMPTGHAAEFGGAMGVETTKLNLRYAFKRGNQGSRSANRAAE